MARTPLQKLDPHRLIRSIRWSRNQRDKFGQKRLQGLNQLVGYHYAAFSGSKLRVPINLIELAVQVFTQQLGAGEPKYMVGTEKPLLRASALEFEVAINDRISRLDYSTTRRRAIMESMFSQGKVKVGIASGDTYGNQPEPGELFITNIAFEDSFHDMSAKTADEVQYEGDTYCVPLLWARNNKTFDAEVRKTLGVRDKFSRSRSERAKSLSIDESSDDVELIRTCDLMDVWIPSLRQVWIMPDDDSGRVLRAVNWKGPKRGPYHTLKYTEVPDNTMPLQPTAIMMDLHSMANSIMRKLARQADRQKDILGFGGSAETDAARIVDAQDGEGVRMDHPDQAKVFSFGGVNKENLAFMLQVRDLFVYLNGNLDALGGLSPQADTLGQDTMLQQAAYRRIAAMQEQVIAFDRSIGEAVAFYEWTDPIRTATLFKALPGLDEGVEFEWSPETRQGDYLDFNFDVYPYSVAPVTPQSKLAGLVNVYERLMLPAMPFMQAAGMTLDWEYFMELVERFGQMPELEGLLVYADPAMQQMASMSSPSDVPKGNPVPGVRPSTAKPMSRMQADSDKISSMMGSSNGSSGPSYAPNSSGRSGGGSVAVGGGNN